MIEVVQEESSEGFVDQAVQAVHEVRTLKFTVTEQHGATVPPNQPFSCLGSGFEGGLNKGADGL